MSVSRSKYNDSEDYYDRDRHSRHSSKYDQKRDRREDDRKIDRKIDDRKSDDKKRYKERDSHRNRSRSRSRRRDKRSRSSSKSKSKKRRTRDRSVSSSSSDTSSAGSLGRELMELSSSESSDEETKHKKKLIAEKVATNQMEFLEQKDKNKLKYKEQKKRQKEILKALETPEEKRLRRLAKKEAKERKRKFKMGWDEELMGYTNADNPFGDSNLHMNFNWKKKYEKMGLKNVSEEQISRMKRLKLEETKRELEKVKQRRQEREREMEARQEEVSRQQREKEAEQFKEWEKQEDYFHLKQAKLRSKLRIKEGRAKPIDLLARYINAFGDDIGAEEDVDKTEQMVAESVEPYFHLNGLRITDLEDLDEDIKVYMTLDSDKNSDYWKDLQIIVGDELYKLRKAQSKNAVESREGINSAVTHDVLQVFNGKTPSQLQALQSQIEKKIRSNEEGIDIGYWETLLSRLKAHIARARLKEHHEQNLIRRSNRMRAQQNAQKTAEKDSNVPIFPIEEQMSQTKEEEEEEEPTASVSFEDTDNEPPVEENISQQMDPTIKCIDDYNSGQYSPKYLSISEIESGILITQPEDDFKLLENHRKQVMRTEAIQNQKKPPLTVEEAAFEREARKGMTNEEAIFSVEEEIKKIDKMYSWSDKYRPRKPRYFNRVHTGFEWNKYNQTHYDVDNPPPKVVQGYKFNIFYPDLIDKSKTPVFKITNCPENRDFALIRFTSGPPYEDICFKIVNREWNYSYKSGYRSQFHNNILQLWFHFKRYRYRR